MQSNVMKLKMLIENAKEIGMDSNKSFESIVRRLSVRWSEYLYHKAVDMIINNNPQNILDTTFRIPAGTQEIQAVDGLYSIGIVSGTDIDFGFTPLQLRHHSVFGGQSGFGKSTAVKVLSQQVISEGTTKVWLIDPKEGGDYRFLAKKFGTLILRPEVMRCNPFNMIKNVPVTTLRESVSETTADSFAVYDASESVITEHVQRIFEEHEQPNLYDFIKSVWSEKTKYGGRRSGYLDTIKSRLTKVNSSLRNIVNCKSDYFSDLYDRDVVFEIGSLSGNAQRILVPWIIMKLVLYKIRNPTNYLSNLLVFDEAQSQIWSRNLEMRGRTSFMATLATQARAFGLGLIVLAQNPGTKLMTEIISNSAIKLCFHLGSGVEVRAMSQHMGLTYEQMEILHHLKRGEAICRVGLGYTEPVSLQVYNFVDNSFDDLELSEIMESEWQKLLEGIEPALTNDPNLLDQKSIVTNSLDKKSTEKNPLKNNSENNKKEKVISATPAGGLPPAHPPLSEDEQIYLKMVSRHPWRLITEVYSLICNDEIMGNDKLSKNRAVRSRKKLISKGCLRDFNVVGTGRSGKSMCDIITEKIGKVEHPRGGLLHSWWCYRVGKSFEKKGLKVKLGDTLVTGNEIDVSVLTTDGKRIGIEVVISALMVENVKKFVDVFDRLIILAINDKKKKEIEKMFSDDISMRIEIGLTKDYFVEL